MSPKGWIEEAGHRPFATWGPFRFFALFSDERAGYTIAVEAAGRTFEFRATPKGRKVEMREVTRRSAP